MSAVAAKPKTPLAIPSELQGPTTSEEMCYIAEVVTRIAAAALAAAAAIYSGSQGWSSYFTGACAGISALLIVLQISDWTGCGRASYARLFNSLKGLVAIFKAEAEEEARMQADNDERKVLIANEGAVNQQLAGVIGAANADSVKMGATVDHAAAVAGQLQAVAEEAKEVVHEDAVANDEVKAQVVDFTKKVSLFQAQVAEAGRAIPELQSINLQFDHSMVSFEANAAKILNAFGALLAQIEKHAAVVAGLQQSIADLHRAQAVLNERLAVVDPLRQNLQASGESMKRLEALLQAQRGDLAQEAAAAAQKEIELQPYIQQAIRACAEQEALLGAENV